MTRITNFGRKRTYLEAGFGSAGVEEGRPESYAAAVSKTEDDTGNLLKKTRKHRRGKPNAVVDSEEPMDNEQARTIVEGDKKVTSKKARSGQKCKRDHDRTKAAASERRRLNRIAERHASTTCLACRKKGHTVKDCPEARTALHEDDDAASAGAPGKSSVGICYRCGSKRHNLSRCKKTVNPKSPFPFASCFVCSEKGHLASSCPQNQGKGIYPNGGSCKLCGQTSHLAKDCELRTQDVASRSAMMLGDTSEGGADEDDFHILKRRRDAVKKEDAIHQRTAIESAKMVVKTKPKIVVFK